MPATVTIPAGRSAVTFDVAAVNDNMVRPDGTVTITATASGFDGGSADVLVTEDDIPSLTVTISAASFGEDAGSSAATGTVVRNTDTTEALVVDLLNDSPGKVSVPATVTIPAGLDSATFSIDAVDNTTVEGTRRCAGVRFCGGLPQRRRRNGRDRQRHPAVDAEPQQRRHLGGRRAARRDGHGDAKHRQQPPADGHAGLERRFERPNARQRGDPGQQGLGLVRRQCPGRRRRGGDQDGDDFGLRDLRFGVLAERRVGHGGRSRCSTPTVPL